MNHSAITLYYHILYSCILNSKIINPNQYLVCYLKVPVKHNLFLVQESFCSVSPHCIIYTSIKNIVSTSRECTAGINMSLKWRHNSS